MRRRRTDLAAQQVDEILRGYFSRLTASIRVPAEDRLVPRLETASRDGLKHLSARRPKVLVAVVLAALIVVGGAYAFSKSGTLDAIGDAVGIREQPPAQPAPNYAPAKVPYISVQPLMYYLGSADPVVPVTAVTRDGERASVFVLDGNAVNYRTRNSYAELVVNQQNVTLGKRVGQAVIVDAGLTPCARVVVDPPASLRDGDRIRSFHVQTAATEGLRVDYGRLFGGRPPASPPLIEGGIAGEQNGLLRLAITYHGNAPRGAVYRVVFPDDSVKELPVDPERSSTDMFAPRAALRQGEPVALVQLLDPARSEIARGSLEPFCTA